VSSDDPEYMTTEEVAALTRRSIDTVRWWRTTRKGPQGFKVGRRVLYRRTEVLAWIAAQEHDQRDR
jgi:hypothetical protein